MDIVRANILPPYYLKYDLRHSDEKSQSWAGMGEVISSALVLIALRVLKNAVLVSSAGPDPYLSGEFVYETIVGVQSVGVQACAKHFIANNQEHWRYG